MLNIIGWIGTICFSLCAVPQVLLCWKTKNADGLSGLTLLLWLVGELAMLIYILLSSKDIILITNYLFNLVCLTVILYYKIKGNKKDGSSK